MEQGYVVLTPHSNTNHSPLWRVVRFDEWADHAYHRLPFPEVVYESKIGSEAYAKCAELNRGIGSPETLGVEFALYCEDYRLSAWQGYTACEVDLAHMVDLWGNGSEYEIRSTPMGDGL